ncbi:MAG: glycosyltransferase [Pseudomonadota bacterium]
MGVMRVAIVHDWLSTFTGAEKVLEQMLLCYPGADLFVLVDHLPEADRGFLSGVKITTSNLQRRPLSRSVFRNFIGSMPYLVEQFDLKAYDLVLSSSWAFAKGVLVNADQPHVSYMHTPIRYASALKHQYLEQSNLTSGPKSWFVRRVLHSIRQWDLTSTNGVDTLIANSRYIAQRIRKTYRREAQVIYPPVDVDAFPLIEEKDDFYLMASRLVPYKRFDLVIEAFRQMPDKRLTVAGSGPEAEKLKRLAGDNVQLLGFVPQDALVDMMQRAKAFIMPAEEDFGIVVAEAQACGTPVISFGRGGAPEILQLEGAAGPTGLVFHEQTPEAVIDAVERFETQQGHYRPRDCWENAQSFGPERFREEFKASVDDTLAGFARGALAVRAPVFSLKSAE